MLLIGPLGFSEPDRMARARRPAHQPDHRSALGARDRRFRAAPADRLPTALIFCLSQCTSDQNRLRRPVRRRSPARTRKPILQTCSPNSSGNGRTASWPTSPPGLGQFPGSPDGRSSVMTRFTAAWLSFLASPAGRPEDRALAVGARTLSDRRCGRA